MRPIVRCVFAEAREGGDKKLPWIVPRAMKSQGATVLLVLSLMLTPLSWKSSPRRHHRLFMIVQSILIDEPNPEFVFLQPFAEAQVIQVGLRAPKAKALVTGVGYALPVMRLQHLG